MTSRWLFGLIVSLILVLFALIGIMIAKILGAATFDVLIRHFGDAMDKAGLSEYVLFFIFLLFGIVIFCLGAYLATRSRWLFRFIAGTSLHPSSLRVTFSRFVSGCRVTTFRDGTPTIYYRLWVRPGKSVGNQNCTGTLVDIMAATRGMPTGHWHSIWEPERLRLCWAIHTRAPETKVDIRDVDGQFLDVFYITEKGEYGFGCEVHPASLDTLSFEVGATYLFVISLACDGEQPQKVYLRLNWPRDWLDESIEMVPS